MDRRGTTFALLALGAAPLAAFAQAPLPDMPRVGCLTAAPSADLAKYLGPLLAGLRDRGYVEGRNIRVEFRSAESAYGRLPKLAAELVSLKVNLVVAIGTPAAKAAKASTATVPIVFVGAGDPVASGLVASLARPGGNVTGTSNLSPPLMVKRLELLKGADPTVKRVGVLLNPSNFAQRLSFEAMSTAARALKVELEQFDASSLAEIRSAVELMGRRHIDGLVVANETTFNSNTNTIVQLAAKERIRSSGSKEFAEAGGLIGYGSPADVQRHAASYVDRILKGEKPAELPVEQPSKIAMAVNLGTAKIFGISIPQSVILRADEVIE